MANLSPWLMLVIGIIIGWLLARMLGSGSRKTSEDQVSALETRLRTSTNELETLRSNAAGLEGEYKAQISELEADLQEQRAALATRTAELDQAQTRMSDMQTEFANRMATVPAGDGQATRSGGVALDFGSQAQEPVTDDFTQIRGIGPAFAARLTEMGITRYADLAAVDPKELPQALGLHRWQRVDTAAWVGQAGRLASRPQQINIGDELTTLEGIGPTYAIRLRAAGITTFRQLADTDSAILSEIIGAPAWKRTNYDDWIAQARLAADGDKAGLAALQDQLFGRKGDNLDLIAGIGDTSLAALQDAGITTYAALAEATPQQIRTILGQAGVRGGNVEGWIAEAKLRASGKRVKRAAPTRARSAQAIEVRSCPQDLEEVRGVGRIYEQRLYAVGVGTFWELGMLSDEQLVSILELREFQKTDLAGIKAEAMRLAQETNTTGHVWDGSEPDDFDGLEGIGPVFERRLYAAGICTHAALAEASKERLEEICRAPSFNRPDFARWIEQARAFRSQPA